MLQNLMNFFGRKILIPLWMILVSTCTLAQPDQVRFPSYSEVVSHFFSEYAVADQPMTFGITDVIQFEKRAEGWKVVSYESDENHQQVSSELLWSAQAGGYKKVNYKPLRERSKSTVHKEQYLNEYSARYFDMSPFYGYPGWDSDLIDQYSEKAQLNDTLLYMLGRAYSNYATGLLNNNQGMAVKGRRFEFQNENSKLSDIQLQEYRNYRHKAIEYFGRVEEMNSDFETIVGSIQVKRDNEYVTSYLDLQMYSTQEEADKELSVELFTPFQIENASNNLNSCLPRSVLFTNGDNDTYPLIYIQKKLGIRPDVLVVNISLLNTIRYIHLMRNQKGEAPALPVSIPEELIDNNQLEYAKVDNSGSEPLALEKVIRLAHEAAILQKENPDEVLTISSPNLKAVCQGKEISWEYPKNYLLRKDIITLDIIEQSRCELPLYFACTVGDDEFLGLDKYLILEGLTYRLTSEKNNSAVSVPGVASETAYDNLMHKFQFNHTSEIQNTEKYWALNYANNFSKVAEKLLTENKKEMAKQLLNKYISVFDDRNIPYDVVMYSFVECYYQMSEFESGNIIITKLLNNLKSDRIPVHKNSMQYTQSLKENFIYSLKSLAQRYDQDTLIPFDK